jgi:hypothetical protein
MREAMTSFFEMSMNCPCFDTSLSYKAATMHIAASMPAS